MDEFILSYNPSYWTCNNHWSCMNSHFVERKEPLGPLLIRPVTPLRTTADFKFIATPAHEQWFRKKTVSTFDIPGININTSLLSFSLQRNIVWEFAFVPLWTKSLFKKSTNHWLGISSCQQKSKSGFITKQTISNPQSHYTITCKTADKYALLEVSMDCWAYCRLFRACSCHGSWERKTMGWW